MKYTILKNCHRSLQSFPALHIGKSEMFRTVRFDKSCIYDLKSNDQLDINKLFGFSYGWHQKDSFRWGWRYSEEKRMTELFAYIYRDGVRDFYHLFDVGFDIDIVLGIRIFGGKANFYVEKEIKSSYYVSPFHGEIGYLLFPYFGGNRKAPHKMIINLTKIKMENQKSNKSGFIAKIHEALRLNTMGGMVLYVGYLLLGFSIFEIFKTTGVLDFDSMKSVLPSLITFVVWAGLGFISKSKTSKSSIARWFFIIGGAIGFIGFIPSLISMLQDFNVI